MFDINEFDSLITFEDIQRAGYPQEAEDALAAWSHGVRYEPAWYMDLPDSILREIETANAMANQIT